MGYNIELTRAGRTGAARMLAHAGWVFGCVATSEAVLAATTTGDHHVP